MAYKKKVTLKDIADASGISVSSVSMILNQRSDVSFREETVEKVRTAAAKLGYQFRTSSDSTASVKEAPKKNIIAIFLSQYFQCLLFYHCAGH